MPGKRTTHRSSTGKKLYAVRNADGSFKDIQTYERAHAADLRKKSKSETAGTAKKSGTKKAAAKKSTAKKSTAEKAAAKFVKVGMDLIKKVTGPKKAAAKKK